jgi:hypothetical protein
MPLTVQKLNSERQTFVWKYNPDDPSEDVTIIYNPQAFTPEVERRTTDEMKGEYKAEVLSFMLSLFLVEWDLEEFVPKLDGTGAPVIENGEPQYELDPETQEPLTRPFGIEVDKLNTLPVTFIGDAISAITGDIRAVRESGKVSGDGSPQAA